MIIGITIVALGTSLPELAVSLASARKGEHSLAFGNIIGSNGFNALAVIGIAAAIQPAELDPSAVSVHMPVDAGFHRGILLHGVQLEREDHGKPRRRSVAADRLHRLHDLNCSADFLNAGTTKRRKSSSKSPAACSKTRRTRFAICCRVSATHSSTHAASACTATAASS